MVGRLWIKGDTHEKTISDVIHVDEPIFLPYINGHRLEDIEVLIEAK